MTAKVVLRRLNLRSLTRTQNCQALSTMGSKLAHRRLFIAPPRSRSYSTSSQGSRTNLWMSALLAATGIACAWGPLNEESRNVQCEEGKGLFRYLQGIRSKYVGRLEGLSQEELRTIGLYRKCTPSVVHITTTENVRVMNFNLAEIPTGTGSGIIWDKEGRIVTNYHVVKDNQQAYVTLSDHTTVKAKVAGYDIERDVAVLQIVFEEGASFAVHPIEVGTSDDLQVGQACFAIGNPFGLDHTLTSGLVSAVGREVPSGRGKVLRGSIQTDAAINPGNSGGALLDSLGRLIGMNTAIYSPTGASIGLGFAIPVNTLKRIVPQLINYGKVITPVIGVHLAPDFHTSLLDIQGVLVLRTQPGSSAEKAGIRPTKRTWRRIEYGDIIQAVNGVEVHSVDDFLSEIENYDVGESVTLRVFRGREKEVVEVKVMLESRE